MSDIKRLRPRILTARLTGVPLTMEERFLLDRIDGDRSVADLVRVTGIAEARALQIVSKLAGSGLVDLGPAAAPPLPPEIDDGGTTSMAELAAALGMDPSAFEEPQPPPQPRLEPVPEVGSVKDLETIADLVERPARAEDLPDEPPTLEEVPDPPTLEDVSEGAESTDDLGDTDERPEHEEPPADDGETAVAERNWRQVYETRWREVPLDERERAARRLPGADLFALCFDPSPQVVAGILENFGCAIEHARLLASHHRTGTGLEMLTRRQDWLRDLLVERRLLRNPMIGDVVLARVMGPKRLLPTYKIAIDRDVPELSRVKCRGYLRQKWQSAPAEERADLLLRTEARCLALMTGCTFDAKTTAILCGRPINSAMFVQSVTKFGAAPPALLAHLYKQPFVRKNAPLRKAILAHPNLPGDVKRSL